jgi:CubicO group peptidase (beta-lactamase class C family)
MNRIAMGIMLAAALLMGCGTKASSDDIDNGLVLDSVSETAGGDGYAITETSSLDMLKEDLKLDDTAPVELEDGSQGADTKPLPPEFEELAAVIEQERVDMDIPGLAVAVIMDGKLAWSKGFGTKDPAGEEPVLPTTLFRFGSIAKMMASTAILQQEAAGCLLVDDALTKHAPDFTMKKTPDGVPDITLAHLMTHASGVSDFLALDVPAAQKLDGALKEYALGLLPYYIWLNAPPGRLWNYSNPNFVLVGLVAELCADQNYRDYMRESVWQPLGMDRTTFRPADVLADGDYALGRSYDPVANKEWIIAPDSYDNAWGAPAGFGFSSVEELAHFGEFLLNGNEAVLADEGVTRLVGKHVDTLMVGNQLWYGYGVMISTTYLLADGINMVETPVWHHGGAINGFSAQMTLLPEFGFGFITLASTDGAYPTVSPHMAAELLVDLPTPTLAPDISDDPSLYGGYEGEFLDPFNVGHMKLTTEDGKLHLQMSDLDDANYPYEPILQPVSLRNYILWVDGYPLPLTIILDDEGKPEYLRTRIAVGRRVDPDEPPRRIGINASQITRQLRIVQPPMVPWFL